MYTKSITANFLLLLHLSYTFFKAPDAMSTLKFENETATQLYKNNFLLGCFSYTVQFNLLPFDPYSEISLLRHKILSAKSWTHDYHWWVPHPSHRQFGMTVHSTDYTYRRTVRLVCEFYWENTGQRASNKGIIYIYIGTAHIVHQLTVIL